MKPEPGEKEQRRAAVLDASRENSWSAPIQTARVVTRDFTELHICARPEAGPLGFEEQARSMYEVLLRELQSHGARPADVVAEKVFLGAATRFDRMRAIRNEFYAEGGGAGAAAPGKRPLAPATSCVGEPPAWLGQLCELQALAILPAGSEAVASRGIAGLPPGAGGRIVEAGDVRHVFVSNLTGGSPGDGMDFSRQATSMFLKAEAALRLEGLSFRDVVRTWIYLADIDRDYAALNGVRRQFFASRGVDSPPASTGIGGIPDPPDRACGLDLRAIARGGAVQIRPIGAASMCEAPSYGSDFSRGMRVDFPDRSVIYVSGTASIDTEGQVVHVGNIEDQVERMLVNVEQVLAGQGAGYLDVVSAITYLKRPEYLDAFRSVAARRGLPGGVPNTICVADVCRPDWLCEMELTAILA